MTENTLPVWMQKMSRSLQQTRDDPASRYFQVASCDEHGLPRNRTMVFRYFDKQNAVITVLSDSRTGKVNQFNKNSHAEICWYFGKSREQFRFTATTDLVCAEQDNERVQSFWQRLSDAGKKQFFWGTPGESLATQAELSVGTPTKTAPSHFCLLDFSIHRVDYLSLKASPQYREISIKNEGNWHCQPVIP